VVDLGRAMFQTEPLGARPGHEVDYIPTVAAWHDNCSGRAFIGTFAAKVRRSTA